MKNLILKNSYFMALVMLAGSFFLTSCSDDDDGGGGITPTGDSKTYTLTSVSDHGISGDVTFNELTDGSTSVEISLTGTSAGNTHPAHIHFNSVAEGGDIAVTLEPVDGATGKSTTIIVEADDLTTLSYEDLLQYDGHINVHLSPDDMATIVAAGDIGSNELTGQSKQYELKSVSDPNIQGTATFSERVSGETLVTLQLENTPTDGTHPAHIHKNSAMEGGDIAITLNSVDGETGMSKTHVSEFDNATDGGSVTYEQLISYDGYINVHQSPENLGTLIAQGDIGANALTGESITYDLNSRSNPAISGTVTFQQRVNNEALVTLNLDNTTADAMHPAHIHMNTAAEGGDIAISLMDVDGTTGMSRTNISTLDDGEAITYDDLLDFNGYVNVHTSADDLGTIIAQGDIGQNALTGQSKVYTLNEVDFPGVTGTATFHERMNNQTLVELELTGDTFVGDHPAHIHMGSVAEAPGDIAITLSDVNNNGISRTNIKQTDAAEAVTYSDLTTYDGYINVHASATDLATLIAQGDIGSNVD